MVGVVANHGYLRGLVYKELSAGRQCEITGNMLLHIKDVGDFKNKKEKLMGKFGEVISRKSDGTALIATRSPPPWAEKKIDEVIWDCEEMIRWDVPIDDR